MGELTRRPIGGSVDDVFDVGDVVCDEGTTLEPGSRDQTCSVTVRYLGGEESAFLEFDISVTGDDSDQQVLGDRRVLLIADTRPGDE